MALDEARLEDLLRFLVERRGSDLHLKVGSAPRIRVDGQLQATPFDAPAAPELERLAFAVLPAPRADEFEATGEADFALGLPAAVQRLAEERRGLVLVTGPTGSGKTTTIASMLDHINTTRAVNVVTIEDPIEVLHHDRQAIVSQREVGADTGGFAEAMRRVLRQDPDVIFVGEMRDAETVGAALTAAETGHLVLSTLHTADTVETVNRIVDFFPAHHHHQIRLTLATSLRGIVSQRLVPRAAGEGRVPAVEILVNTGRVFDRIVDPDVPGESLRELVAAGDYYGMQTFDQALLALYRDSEIGLLDALATATNPSDLRIALQQAGLPLSAVG